MFLNKELLDRCEEFFDLVAVDGDTTELDFAIDSLRQLLEGDVDGWTQYSAFDLACATQERVEEIWSLIPESAKKSNFNLCDHYEELTQWLEEESGYEAADEDEFYNYQDEEEETECDDYTDEYDHE